MGFRAFNYRRVDVSQEYGRGSLNTLPVEDFKSFNPSVLDLGNINIEGGYADALAVIFDLAGFTQFSAQPDPHLVIGEFLSRFLDWLFTAVAGALKEKEDKDLVRMWGSLPFFSKFLGDGVLFLWDTSHSGGLSGIGNIIWDMHGVTRAYRTDCLPKLSPHVANPPLALRCGIARGRVISVGNNADFVGPCMNIASRLQKLGELTFAVSRRGVDPEKCFDESRLKLLVTKRVQIRGVGDTELIVVDRHEVTSLPDAEKALLADP